MGRPYFAEWIVMLSGASAFEQTSEAVAVNPTYAQSVEIFWSRGCKDGEVVVECASSKNFGGQWAELHRFNWTGDNKLELYEHNGPCVFIRTRVSKSINGGTVTTKLQCMIG